MSKAKSQVVAPAEKEMLKIEDEKQEYTELDMTFKARQSPEEQI